MDVLTLRTENAQALAEYVTFRRHIWSLEFCVSYRSRVLAVLLLVASALVPAYAGNLAAVPMTVTPIYMGTANVLGVIDAARRTNERVYGKQTSYQKDGSTPRDASTSRVSTATGSDFSVANDPAVSAQARHLFLAGIVKSSGTPVAYQLDQKLGAIKNTFSRVAMPYGLRADDFGDVLTAYTVVLWLAANRQPDLPQVMEVNGVRRQLRDAIAGKLGDPKQRQLVAEQMMYQTCMLIVLREEAKGDPAVLDTIAQSIDKGSTRQGAQLRQLALTNQGLVPR